MSTINPITRSTQKSFTYHTRSAFWLALPAFRQSQQNPVQSHQTLLPPSPFAPPTNCRAKGLGHGRLTMIYMCTHWSSPHNVYFIWLGCVVKVGLIKWAQIKWPLLAASYALRGQRNVVRLNFKYTPPSQTGRKLLLLTVLVLWWASREVGWLLSRSRGRTPRWSTARKAWWCCLV